LRAVRRKAKARGLDKLSMNEIYAIIAKARHYPKKTHEKVAILTPREFLRQKKGVESNTFENTVVFFVKKPPKVLAPFRIYIIVPRH
jgi:hypothetical protein